MTDAISSKDFRPKGEVLANGALTKRWWQCDGEANNGIEVAKSIGTEVQRLVMQQGARTKQYIISARYYGGSSLYGVSGASTLMMLSSANTYREPMTDNVTQSVIDTATAVVGENKPRPYFLTNGGTYHEQRKAKNVNKFADGIFYENNAYELGGEAQRDAEIFGDGLIHVYTRDGRVAFERTLASEHWVDEIEAQYGSPRTWFWVRYVDKMKLVANFPEAEELIMRTPRAQMKDRGTSADISDMLSVCEAWHLRSGPKAKDGMHCIALETGLIDPLTPWNRDHFPFARFRWSPRPLGYWSQGLAEQLQTKQKALNKLDWLIERSHHMAGTYKVLVEMGSEIVEEHISNQVGVILKYRGKPPEWYTPQAVQGALYEWRIALIDSMFELSGINRQAATGTKPEGLDSGEAQRVYRDTTTQRLKTFERLNERGYMDLVKVALAEAKEIAEEKGHYEVRAPSGRSMTAIRLTPDDLDDDDWSFQCFPTSSLPKDPGGRLATIQSYIQAGFMTPRQGRRAMDFPDLEAYESMANAGEDLITKLLDDICDEGVYAPCPPSVDLSSAKEMVTDYINMALLYDLEPERLGMLYEWSAGVDAMVAMAAPPPMPTPQVPQGTAPTAPVSNLMAQTG